MTAFTKYLYRWYQHYGRAHLPWRKTIDPYQIWVSEVMLQQTQVERVISKYTNFLEHFPTISSLSETPLEEVLRLWQGLGYNRRAKHLWLGAQQVAKTTTILPELTENLLKIPGIGEYTAKAIQVFARNQPEVLVETNVRSVMLHHFFPSTWEVDDTEIKSMVVEHLDRTNARAWYAALMDYGTVIKKLHKNPNARSKHFVKQSRFEGSKRQVRGRILSLLLTERLSLSQLTKKIGATEWDVESILEELEVEGLIKNQFS